MSEPTKRCTICGFTKPLADFYQAKRGATVRYQSACKSCHNAQAKASRNTDRQRAYDKAYRETNHERRIAQDRAYHAANREQRNAAQRARRANDATDKQREYREANRERIQAWRREYWQRKGDEGRERNQAYRQAMPEQKRIREHRARAKKYGVAGDFTRAEFEALCTCYGHRCLCCGRHDALLVADHVVSMSAGGSNTIENVQPLCYDCNRAKGTRVIDYRLCYHQ